MQEKQSMTRTRATRWLTVTMLAVTLMVGSTVWTATFVSANHPVLVEGEAGVARDDATVISGAGERRADVGRQGAQLQRDRRCCTLRPECALGRHRCADVLVR